MVKYARIVFEVEMEDDATDEETLDTLEVHLGEFISNPWGIDSVEMHNRPYIADECNGDLAGGTEEKGLGLLRK